MTRLRQIMNERGLSLRQLAALTGLDARTILHATSGKKLNASTRRLLALTLQLEETELFDVDGSVVPAQSMPVIEGAAA